MAIKLADRARRIRPVTRPTPTVVSEPQTELQRRIASVKTDPSYTKTVRNGKVVYTKKGDYTNIRFGGRRVPQTFQKKEYIVENGKTTEITRDVYLSGKDVEQYSPYVVERKVYQNGQLVQHTGQEFKGYGRGMRQIDYGAQKRVPLEKPGAVRVVHKPGEAPRVVERLLTEEQRKTKAKKIAERRREKIEERLPIRTEERGIKPTTEKEFAERIFGLQKRKVTALPTGELEVEKRVGKRKEVISLPTGRIIAEVPISARVAPEFIPFYEKQIAREKAKKKFIELGGIPGTVRMDVEKISPVLAKDMERKLAEAEFLSKAEKISEERLKALEIKGRHVPGGLKVEVTGERFDPIQITPAEARGIKEEREFMEFERRFGAVQVGGAVTTGTILAAGKRGVLRTAFEFKKRPVKEAVTFGAIVGVSAISAPAALVVGGVMVAGAGVSTYLKTRTGVPLPLAAAETVGGILPYAAVGGAVAGVRKGARFVKGAKYEIGKLKGVFEIERTRLISGERVTEKFPQPILETYVRRFKKKPKPSKEFLIKYEQEIIGQVSPIEITQRFVTGFAIVRKDKKGIITTEKIGFPEVEVGKTEFAAPKTLLPFEPLKAEKITTYKAVAVKGFKRIKLEERLVIEDVTAGITESGRVIYGLKARGGIPRYRETTDFVETKIDVEPYTRYLRRDIMIKAPKRKPKEARLLPSEPLSSDQFLRLLQTSRLVGVPIKKAKLPEELRFEFFPERRGRPVKVTPGYIKMLKYKKAQLMLEKQRQQQQAISEKFGKVGDIWEVKATEQRILSSFMVSERIGVIALPTTMQQQIQRQKLFQKPTFDLKPISKTRTIMDVILRPGQAQKIFTAVAQKSKQKQAVISRVDLFQRQVPKLKQRERPRPRPDEFVPDKPIIVKFKLPTFPEKKKRRKRGEFGFGRQFKYQAGLREIMTGITARKAPVGAFAGLFTGEQLRPIVRGGI